MQDSSATTEYYLSLPQPEAGESFERYAIRAHRELAKVVRDPEDRNVLIEEYWREAMGPTQAEQMAADKLDPERYERKGNVCIFTEHETVDSQGKPKKYDLRELVRIVRNANERIADIGAFPAISDGHTPPPNKPDAPKPGVLGYVGGYRLGQIGRVKPRWAIFEDEYHDKRHAERIKELPRRSVELWTFKDSGKSHFDPIAALGSEAPRLPLPIAFEAINYDGAEVEKYTFEAAAAAPSAGPSVHPGGGNTHVKGFAKPKRKKYQQTNKGAGGMQGTLSDQDLAQIVGAINETPEFNWIRKKMQEDMADEQAEVAGDNLDLEGEEEEPEIFEEPEEDILPEAVEEAAEEEPDEELADISDLLAEEAEEEEEPERMSAPNAPDAALVEKFNALSASHAKLIRQHGTLLKRVEKGDRERADAQRREALRGLHQKFPDAVVLDEEFQATLYSAGANMTDEDFDSHVATIERYCSRAAPAAMIPVGVGEAPDGNAEKYEARTAELAVEICTKANAEGMVMDFDAGLEEARKRIGAPS